MDKKTCPHFDKCGAPLCPLEDDKGLGWFKDEPVCNRYSKATFTVPHWLTTQRKIAKRSADFDHGYFTRKMMDRHIMVRAGTRGLNPNHALTTEAQRVSEWILKHPAIVVTEAMRETARIRFERAVLGRGGNDSA